MLGHFTNLQEDGVTYERALVLFCFCSELCLRALREASSRYFHTVTSMSLRFITGSLSMWVCASGGWVSYFIFNNNYLPSLNVGSIKKI
jgi:hypothetical protein